jgi:virulence-associated protein VapD
MQIYLGVSLYRFIQGSIYLGFTLYRFVDQSIQIYSGINLFRFHFIQVCGSVYTDLFRD